MTATEKHIDTKRRILDRVAIRPPEKLTLERKTESNQPKWSVLETR